MSVGLSVCRSTSVSPKPFSPALQRVVEQDRHSRITDAFSKKQKKYQLVKSYGPFFEKKNSPYISIFGIFRLFGAIFFAPILCGEKYLEIFSNFFSTKFLALLDHMEQQKKI